MTPENLVAFAATIARPCLRLSSVPMTGRPVAWWGAHHAWRSPDGLDNLLLVDFAELAEHGGVASKFPPRGTGQVFLRKQSLTARFETDPERVCLVGLGTAREVWRDIVNPYTGSTLGRKCTWEDLQTDVIPLWATLDKSLPWTSDLVLQVPELAQDAQAIDAYERHYLSAFWGDERNSLLTLGRERTFAIVGGWPFPIDGELVAGELALTVLACSEPQVEVWRMEDGRFNVITRVT